MTEGIGVEEAAGEPGITESDPIAAGLDMRVDISETGEDEGFVWKVEFGGSGERVDDKVRTS